MEIASYYHLNTKSISSMAVSSRYHLLSTAVLAEYVCVMG